MPCRRDELDACEAVTYPKGTGCTMRLPISASMSGLRHTREDKAVTSAEDHPMRFGIFLAPFHKPGINPTLALQNDLDLVVLLDRLGYNEAWFGEHHSAGTEISASPEIMIAVAAERTRHIKLGTGVVSLSYHNPLWVAERIVLLDHLTRGRAMFGAGPGSLP